MLYRGKYLVKCYTPDEFYAVKEALKPVFGQRVPFHQSTIEDITYTAWGHHYKDYSCGRCLRVDFDSDSIGWDVEEHYGVGHQCHNLIAGHKIVNASEFMNDVFGVDISGCTGFDIDVESYI